MRCNVGNCHSNADTYTKRCTEFQFSQTSFATHDSHQFDYDLDPPTVVVEGLTSTHTPLTSSYQTTNTSPSCFNTYLSIPICEFIHTCCYLPVVCLSLLLQLMCCIHLPLLCSSLRLLKRLYMDMACNTLSHHHHHHHLTASEHAHKGIWDQSE
jgi:hypothetical protein